MNTDRLDRWLFDSFRPTARGLAAYRIAYALFVLLLIDPGHSPYFNFHPLAGLPDSFFLPPPGPMQLFSGFPPRWFFAGLHLLLDLSLVALLFGYRTRLASWMTGLLFLIGFGFLFSAGKINHVILFVLLPWVMSFSNWGAAWSLDARLGRARPTVEGWPLALLALLTGFAMFTAGFTKLLGGWLDPATQATRGHWLKQYFVVGRQDLLADLVTAPLPAGLWELMDWGTVLLEIGLLPAVLVPGLFRMLLSLMVLFHLGTALLFNITFVQNLIVYAAFLNWDRVATRFPRIRLSPRPAFVLIPLLGLAFYFFGSPLRRLDALATFSSDLSLTELLANITAALVVLGLALSRARHLLRRPLPLTPPAAGAYRRARRALAVVLVLYAALVGTHAGEFWPMSVFPMFSRAGQPWTRAVVRALEATEPVRWDTLQAPATLPGRPFPLNTTALDPVDLINFVTHPEPWDARRRQTLQQLFGPELEGRRLLVLQVQGAPSAEGVQLRYVPILVLTADTVQVHPALQP
ncbi:HTTM domain-containing protein [Rhodothermus marinus]|uniref:HTTM domain protein n=1 Tax=Rhodothermus marinus (strain ATCC 43812 / DSM 4252 / R-10) TaxID=518766 RepID=D0MGQ2_RHOM4|nr:HTTM domain-containing protein [Rhodothermus marinus]ACY49615.1 HTTM domain protein [Rhodothermus marinus DSM 4252]